MEIFILGLPYERSIHLCLVFECYKIVIVWPFFFGKGDIR